MSGDIELVKEIGDMINEKTDGREITQVEAVDLLVEILRKLRYWLIDV